MRNVVIVILFFGFALFYSCSSESVKSSENYIERFEIPGYIGKPKSDQSLIDLFVFEADYGNVLNAEPIIEWSKNAELLTTEGKRWTEEGFLYTVTAENGEKKNYSVVIDMTVPKRYSFETWDDTKGYWIPSDTNSRWTSGNEGISLALPSFGKDNKNPENYPTRKTTEGYNNSNAVLLETIAGGIVPVVGKKPLLSGNFILGNFNMLEVLRDELAATEIGRIYPAKPKKITGWYKYKEGGNVFISGKDAESIPGKPDSCSMIVKFYKSDLPNGKDTTLNVRNIDDSELVIAETRKEDCSATAGDGFHPFELELKYKPGKEQLDTQSRYKLGITFASSKDGDTFSGKIGSRLIIDEIKIIDF
jgi:hypothetical protein